MLKKELVKPIMAGYVLITLTLSSIVQAAVNVHVIVEKAQEWQQIEETTLYCSVNAPFVHQISSHTQAELTDVLPTGSTVKAGELVAEQDGYYLASELAVIRTDLELAETQLKHAEEELVRLKTLRKSELVSKSQLNELMLSVNMHRLNRQRLKQQLQTNKYRFEHLKHYAPFSGQVLQVDASPGERLNAGQRIAQLLPLEKKQLECKIPQEHAPKATSLDNFEFRIRGELIPLRDIGRTVDTDTQNLTLYFDGNGERYKALLVGQRFRLSMLKRLESIQKTESITRVPSDAVKLEGSTYQVWAVDGNNTVHKLPVRILDTLATHFVVQSEIKPGDLLVMVGHEGLQEDQEVVPLNKGKS
ncbi:efflux RND transporter periplasmic adaptor subunit [Microbulbifer sp. 2304DJ12-6]|uniref:efflux RND transporter periplasmic adaptor subunit n=1 Tax=Microbulbifer sp. 2304DJ12-6 TaxID=3233340 RepID=UPI0039B010AA